MTERWPQVAIAAGLCVAAFASGGFYPTTFGAIAVAIWLVVGVTALTGAAATISVPRPSLIIIAIATAFTLWTAVSLSWASDRGAGYEDIIRALAYLGTFLVFVLWTAGRQRQWLEGILLGGGLVVVVALAARLLGLDGNELAEQLPASGGRLSFPIGYWNALGLLAAIVAILSVWVAGSASARMARIGAGLIPVCVMVVVLTDSRGAMVAAIAGAVITVGFVLRRRLAAGAVTAAILTSVPALIALLVADAVRGGSADRFGVVGLLIAVLTIAASTATAASFGRLAPLLPEPSWRPNRIQVGAVVAILLGIAALVGPGVFAGGIGGGSGVPGAGSGGASLISGSGRSEFWSVALDGFRDNPARGLGAGGYQNWWNANGTLPVSIQNAHSAPLETLAELGLPGFLLLIALGLTVLGTGLRRLRVAVVGERSEVGAALGLVVAIGIGASLDWIYEVPAVFGIGIVAAAVICSGGIAPARGPTVSAYPSAGWRPGQWGYALFPVTLVAVIAAGALAVGSDQLDRADEAIDRGDLVEAAGDARASSRFMPWSSEPDLVLAEVEQTAGNDQAALRSAEAAARKNPEDYRGWLLLASIRLRMDDSEAANAYGQRVIELAGEVLPRAVLESGIR